MSNDDQLDQQLRRIAERSMQRRAEAVDANAALDDHRARVEHSHTAARHDRRWLAAAAAVIVLVAGITAIAWPRGADSPDLVATETALTTIPVVSASESPGSSTTMTPPTVSVTTVVPSTVPPTTMPPFEWPETSVGTVVEQVERRPPTSVSPFVYTDDSFATVSTDRPGFLAIRSPSELVTELEVPCAPEATCTVRSTRWTSGSLWVATAEVGTDGSLLSSRVISVTPETGEVREHLALPGITGVGAADLFQGVVSAGLDADGRVLVHALNSPYDAVLLAVEGTEAIVIESRVSGFRLSDDGRFLAVGFSHPPTSAPNYIEVSDLVDDVSSEFMAGALNAGPGEWSDDGRFLIVNEQWEDGRAWAVAPWSGSGEFVTGTVDPESTDPSYFASLLRDTTCFIDDSTVAYRTWDVGYGQGDAQPGSIAIRSLEAGEQPEERGTDLFGSFDIRCHADGSVSYLRRPVAIVEHSPEFSQLEPVLDAPVELVRVAPDGTETVMDSGQFRFV